MRQWYEVRVREKVGPDRWCKKSRFYFARDTRDAAGKYKGPGSIMSCEKVGKEKPLGTGSFFSLGDKLLKEFAEENKLRGLYAEGTEATYQSRGTREVQRDP